MNGPEVGGENARADALSVEVHGSAVTIEDAIEVGAATKRLLKTVGRELGEPDVDWQVVSVAFQCDGCYVRRPDRPRSDEGWTHADGDDFCPDCTAERGGAP